MPDMQQLVASLSAHGTLLVFAVTLVARLGIPLPAASLLAVAGSLAAAGQLSWGGLLLGSVADNVVGDSLWYEAGRRHGLRVLKLLFRLSPWPDADLRRGETLIARWGGGALIAAKFLPGVNRVTSPLAGALGMLPVRFLGFELIAASLWAGAYLLLGMVFSSQIRELLDAIAGAGALAVAVLALLLLLAWVGMRNWRLRRAAMPRIGAEERKNG